jgi:TRAP-type mannitol/chloroaromatic compound transport system permease large subunit
METAGVWMLVTVGLMMVTTGLPAWIVLIGVALVSSLVGLAAGAFTWPLLTALPSRVLGLLENDLLQAMPLYVFMGALLNRLPLADILLRVGERAFSRTGAGAPLAGLGLGVVLAPMNGSVGAGIAMLTRTVLPRLNASGVPLERGAALVTVSSTLGVVIPPSLVLILLSDAMLRAHTEALNVTHAAVRIVNTQDIFRGALVPACILLLLCVVVAWVTGAQTPEARSTRVAPSLGDWVTAALTLAFILGLLAAVTLGYLYAVEAAATGGVTLFVLALATGTLKFSILKEVLRDTMVVTGALFALLIGATVFTLIVRAFGTDRWVMSLLAGSATAGIYGPLLAVMLTLGLCAFVLDAFEMTFVVVPVLIPPLLMRVPDATWVAVLTLLILQTSFLIPPFGYAVLMLRNRLGGHLDGGRFVRALLPYLIAQLAVLALILTFPTLLWHDRATLVAPASGGLSDQEIDELLRRQTEPDEPARAK